MKHMRYCLFLVLLFAAFPVTEVVAQLPKERVQALENSPARTRLAEIQQYKPQIRRSRSIAIQELEKDLASAIFKLEAAEKIVRRQERLIRKKDSKAWSPERVEEAKAAMTALEDYIEVAEEYLDVAIGEHEKLLALLARERSEHSIEEDEEYEDDDDDGNSSIAIPNRGLDGLEDDDSDEDDDQNEDDDSNNEDDN